jgi:curved DNA-binding protein CbpA
MARQHIDYYAILGIARSASGAEVDRAYRRAARATHPDIHPDDVSAAERFHEVTDAYETLSDPGRRAAYDYAHPAVRRSTPAPITVRRRHEAVAPVELGRRSPAPEPLQAFRGHIGHDETRRLSELVEALSRALFDRPFL